MQPRMLLATYAAGAYCWLMFSLVSSRKHRSLFCQAALQTLGSQFVVVPEIIIFQVQDMAFSLVELYEILDSPSRLHDKVLVDSSTTFWCTCYSSQFCVIYKLAEGPILQVISEDVKHWP